MDPCKVCDHDQDHHDQFTKVCNECDCARYEWVAYKEAS